ncbi:MAG: tRNA dihydrouridine synthase DusB [Candidatus Gracilibacteria bacterium]
MAFSWEKIKKPIIALAPMAGYTDSAYRQIVKQIIPEVICFSELTSISAINHNNEKTLRMLNFAEIEQPLIVQLFGKTPQFFAEAGKRLEQMGIAGIDINMGCPARKVTKSSQGSALIKDSLLAAEIVHALSKAVKIPVSVKTRLGYGNYDEKQFIDFLKGLESAGAKLITIHGRTTKQGFSGTANWDQIYLAKSILKIPIIGNGDITSSQVALERLKSPDKKITLDGLMIGRATFGNPWLLKEIYAKLNHKRYSPPQSLSKKIPTIKKHLKLSIKNLGEKIGLMEMRKHLGSYIKDIPNASSLRQNLIQAPNLKETLQILDKIAKSH